MTRRLSHFTRPLGVAVAGVSLLVGPLALAVSPSDASTGGGTVKVLAAGSLSNVMTLLGASFKKATGDTLQVTTMGSTAIATGIKAKTLLGDVFLSASVSADLSLEGRANGAWITHYSTFGTSPDVLAYSPTSSFAHALRTLPWYEVITASGFELGRTDPAVDPGGVLDDDALKGIGYAYNMPALLRIATNPRDVYGEDALPGLLQAGQLDGAFMYAVSAHAAHLPFVPLTGTRNLEADYTVATLKGAPDASAAATFVAWLGSPAASRILISQGLSVVTHGAG